MFVFFLLVASCLHAKTYFVSASGNNSNTGLTEASSWQTISQINSFNFAMDDVILFKRGDVFYGSITITQHNLTYGAYGTGAKPIISGLSTITGWVNLGGNIWEAPTTGVKATNNLVLRNGRIQQIGRYPNADATDKGYLTYTAATTSSITGPANSSVTNWTGAEVAIRINRWEILRKKVTAHSAGVVNFAAHSTTPRLNYGYFFQRDARTLDQDGEWWQDGTNNKLRMYFSNNNPSAYTIQASTVDILISNSAGYYRNVYLDSLSFIGAGTKAIYILSGENHKITNCDVINSGAEAISILTATNVIVDKCTTKNSLGSGIQISNNNNITLSSITNCTVDSTALIAGMETSNQSNGGEGIVNRGGNNVYVNNCRVLNSGYVGIGWFGNDTYIKYNLVDAYCKVRDDGAGIYTAETMDTALYQTRYNRNVVGNIVINGIGQGKGTSAPNDINAVTGIYVDDGAADVSLDSNTVAYIPKGAFHGNNNRRISITNNTTFNTGFSFSTQRLKNGKIVIGMRVAKNIFYPYRFQYRNLARDKPNLTLYESITALGILDSNYYSLRPGVDTSITAITTLYDGTGYIDDFLSFNTIKTTFGIETKSINVPNTGSLEYNASSTPRVVSFSGLSKKDVFGNVYNNSVTIPAWSSKVLIPNVTSTTSNKAPLADAGTSIVITLPTSSVTLSGTATDTDGTIASYAWVKTSGPAEGAILTPTAATTSITGLTAGIYQYELTVKDNFGAIGKDTVQVIVNAAVSTSFKASAVESAVNCTGTSSTVSISSSGGVSPYTGTGIFNTNAGKGTLKISFPTSVSTTQTTIYFSVGNIVAGKNYVLRFTTLGSIDNVPMDITLKKYVSPFTLLAISKTTIFGTSTKQHEFIFTPTISDTAARIDLWLTQNAGIIYMDNIAFFEANTAGELIGNNVITKGQFETDISAVRFWSSNSNQLLQWDNSSKIGNINYYTVTDAAGAKSTIGIAIKQPATVLTAAVSSVASNALTVTASGGAAPYSGTGTFVAKVGLNTFIVTDANGCSSTASISIATLTAARVSTAAASTSVTATPDATLMSNTLKMSSYPNPTTSTFKLLAEGKSNEKINIIVMSEDGRTVFQTAGITNKIYAFGSSFVRGLYIIKVIQGNNLQTLKVIKM